MLMLEDKLGKIINMVAERIKGQDIGCYDDDGYMYDGWDSALLFSLEKVDPDIRVAFGMSKMVIIPSFSQFVIKFPLKGSWTETDGFYNEEGKWKQYEDDDFHYEFCSFGYGGGENGDDYCALELSIYDRILEEAPDCSFIFPETYFYGEVEGTKFYLQKKCVEFDDAKQIKVSENSRRVGDELYRHYCYVASPYWVNVLVEKAGETFAKKVLDVIEEFDITDLHNHNLGFDLITGMPMIIDFCGFEG